MTRSSQTPGSTASKPARQGAAVTTTSRVREVRQSRGLGAADVARRIGVSRQTIYAIEAGEYVPNTTVALQLARLLEVRVDDLFVIDAESAGQPFGNVTAELLASGADEYSAGELVRLGRVGSHTIAVPAPRFPTFLSDADGAISSQGKSRATIRTVVKSSANGNALVIAGCDPALSVLASELKLAGTEVISVPGSSQDALHWLRKGLVHVAGTHLRDSATGQYNLPLVTSLFGKQNVRVVTFAEWEQGLVVRRGNPKRIRSVADLGGGKVAIVNREKGSGARDLLDTHLRAAGIPAQSVQGYNRVEPSHLAATLAVANSHADCCVATVSAARCFGMDFVPLSGERFDLIVASADAQTVAIQSLFDVLNRSNLRRKLVLLAGYEVRHTGETLI